MFEIFNVISNIMDKRQYGWLSIISKTQKLFFFTEIRWSSVPILHKFTDNERQWGGFIHLELYFVANAT